MSSTNRTNKRKLLVFGSIVQDLISYTTRFPKPGESIRGKLFKMSSGGKGANQAVMAAILGADVTMVGLVGDDVLGEGNISSIKSFGVDTRYIEKSMTAATGTGCIYVTDDGENCIVVTPSANLELNAERARAVESGIAAASLVMCQSEVDQGGNIEAFKLAKKYNVTTFLNPAPGSADLNRSILSLTDIICTNENEAEFITGQKLYSLEDFQSAAKKILEYGPRVSIVTMGPKGALVAERHAKNGEVTIGSVAAPKVNAVDTTGAGDCFCGTFAYFYTQNPEADILPMVQKATTVASMSVQRHGAQMSYPSRDELIQIKVL